MRRYYVSRQRVSDRSAQGWLYGTGDLVLVPRWNTREAGHGHEAAGVHHPIRRRRGLVAYSGACATDFQHSATHRNSHKFGFKRSRRTAAHIGFSQALQKLGWIDGGNVRIDTRWAEGNAESIRRHASELVAIDSSVVLATGSATVEALLRATRAMPIVFVNVPDPVGSGVVASLSRPGGNATGFTPYEYSTSGKWLELLKEIAPAVKRVAIIRDPAEPAGVGQAAAIQSQLHCLVSRSYRLICATHLSLNAGLMRSREGWTVD